MRGLREGKELDEAGLKALANAARQLLDEIPPDDQGEEPVQKQENDSDGTAPPA